ncbi:MAG TPA: glycine zipper family protein, partial [Stellaceae bacterium]|nr:glycine zipper family protein [Stellaceae bacterium]
MKTKMTVIILASLAGCASQPIGPTVNVMPAPNKPFERFAEEDAFCRDFARQQIAGAPEQANSAVIGSAIVGTVLGAGLGAAVGGGQGAAAGAATGTIIGTGVGSSGAAWAQMTIQQRYNVAFMQCMYAKGNQVPGYSVVATMPPPPPPPPA